MSKAFNSVCLRPIKRMANSPALLAVVVLLTLLLAGLGFAAIEGGSVVDGLYWASTTITSVGYGDLSPATTLGKVLTIVFQLWSLFILLPCAVANIIDSVRIDEHKMTHAEQEWMFGVLEKIADERGIEVPPHPEDY